MPTYNFANVVDDHLMHITHVIRGSEYLSSAPKYNLLYEAFGWQVPTYIHCPPVMKDAHIKLSKRNGDASYQDLVAKGYLSEAILNYLLLLGWSPKGEEEIFSLEEMVKIWNPANINKSPAIFDTQKLTAINAAYIRALPAEKFAQLAAPWLDKAVQSKVDRTLLCANLQPRCEFLADIPPRVAFIDTLPDYELELFENKKQKTKNPRTFWARGIFCVTSAVSALALHAGLDMDMMTNGYITTLKKSLEEGRVSQADIDQACRRVLEAKYKLGLFEDPYRYLDADRAKKNTFTDEHMNTARHIAGKSIVLLKNDKGLLPLRKTGTIAVVGPLADKKVELFGTWCGIDTAKSASVVQAVQEMVGNKARVIFAKGCNLTNEPMLAKASGLKVDPVENTRLVKEAVEQVKDADRIIAVMGEPNNWSGEACSRADISLPESQKELLRALLETGKPVVLVLANGRPLTLEWEDSQFSAIVEAWHGGSAAARGLVDVLFGDVNPSGKLTTTFPRSVGQIPLYYNAKKTGRPMNPDDHFTSKYLDITNDPLYPFGYGLSYTTFSYGDLQLDKTSVQGENGVLTASVQVTNTGKLEGEEVVQLYIGDPAASISRPMKELKNFQKISLKPGESRKVSFTITPEDLKFYNSALEYIWEPGLFNIYVGTNSRDVKSAQVTWNK